MTLEAVDAPLDVHRRGLMSGGVVVVTDDGRGIARALGEAFSSEGHPVAIVGRDRVDLSSPSAVAATLDEIRASGPIAGIVHALPLQTADAPALDAVAWSERMEAEVKGLFLLARAASPDLDLASKRGGACLVAATAMGGAFATAGEIPTAFFPGQGGIAGLVKTLAREWPDVRTRVVDLDPYESPETLAARLATEALNDNGWPEVGYRHGQRIRLRAVASRLDRSAPSFSLAPGEPVLITGGARGITAAVAEELARRWRPTLLLVGSSPLPTGIEDPTTSGLVSPSELKAALHDRLCHSGRAIGATDLEHAYRTLLNERQIRATLSTLRDAGSVVDYARADVRDAEALARALEAWRSRFGDPVGLIHGAGVIHDKLLRDKTPESFDRVLGTKLAGALNLARLLRPEPLRFAALFSSIAGRFGNKGQSDYAAANDALNKLAVWLDRRMAGRVVSVNWGPWSGVGMVSDLEGHLGKRGLGMIPPEVGRTAMADELMFGRKGDVEVVVAGELGSLDDPLPIPSGDAQ
jgi:NAD(P)-dependent dehydrogenase (short-subunit alcohol dehydrogenase family)